MTITLALAALVLARPAPTAAAEKIVVDHVRVVLEREGARVKVSQFFRFGAADGEPMESAAEITLPLPAGALGPRLVDDEAVGISVGPEGFVVTGAIPAAGRMASIAFRVPITDARVVIDQQIGRPVRSAEVISTWTARGAKLEGRGFGIAGTHRLSSGLEGLVGRASNLADGRLHLTLTGLGDGPEGARRMVALVASILALVGGLICWWRDRCRSD